MSNSLTRGILRISKRSRTSTTDKSEIASIRSDISSVSQINGGEWTKYDERIIDCINRADMIKLKETLKKKGVSPVKVSRAGKTAIHHAVQKHCLEGVDLMLQEHQPDLSCIDMQDCRTVYHIAAVNSDTIMLKKLVDYSKTSLDVKDIKGRTALHYAAAGGELESVKILVQSEALLDIVDNDGRTALHVAVIERRIKVAMLLINEGCDVNMEDKERNTAIMIACSNGLSQLVSLLLQKGGQLGIQHRPSVDLGKLASDAGHVEVVQVLEKWERSGSAVGNGDANVCEIDGNEHSKEANGNGFHNGDSHSNSSVGNDLDDEEHCKNKVRAHQNDSSESVNRKSSNPLSRISLSHTNGFTRDSVIRRSVYGADENSLTSSIIESLLSLDNISDDASESSLTEDNVHLYERFEDERRELKNALAQKDLCVEELHAEIDSLKNKVAREMEFRTSAEKEVQQLKLELETKINGYAHEVEAEMETVCGKKVEKSGEEEQEEVQDQEAEYVEVGKVEMNNENERQDGKMEEEVRCGRINEETDIDDYDLYDTESDADKFLDGNVAGSDTDDSINVFTGYHKKSLGTAKQHIDMLEERILCLEEELVDKTEQIHQLEKESNNANEYIELSKRTSVPLEVHNELKSISRQERSTYKQHIAALQETILRLGGNDDDYTVPLVLNDDDSESKRYCDITEHSNLEYDVSVLKTKLGELEEEILTSQLSMEETIRGYRDNIVALHENKLDAGLKEILENIVSLRATSCFSEDDV